MPPGPPPPDILVTCPTITDILATPLVSPAMSQMTFLHLLLSRAWMIVNLNFEMQLWLLIPLGMYLSPDSI